MMPSTMLDGKVVAITGGGSGIGRAAVGLFAEAGAKLIVGDIDEISAKSAALSVEAAGGEALAVVVDVSDERGVHAMMDAALDRFGRIDGAFNNAGVPRSAKPVEELDLEEWHHVMDVNATGVYLCMKHQVRAMWRTGGGAIVNTCSASGSLGQALASDYVASKHAVLGLTRAVSTEYGRTGVRVNAIMPGMVETPMVMERLNHPDFQGHREALLDRHSVGRFAQPDDIALVARFLLSDQSRFINGAAIPVDGGYSAR